MKRKKLPYIVPLMISIGLIARPFLRILFRKPVEAFVNLSYKTNIAWAIFIPLFFALFFYFICLKDFLKMRKSKKYKNDKKIQRTKLVVIIFLAIIISIFVVVAVVTQIALATRDLR